MNTFAINIGQHYFDTFDVALCTSTGTDINAHCQMCLCAIRKGSLRLSVYYNGNGNQAQGLIPSRHRRYFHDNCVLQRANVATMAPAQRLRLEQQRTKLMQQYSAGRLLLAQRRNLLHRLELLMEAGTTNSEDRAALTTDVLEDICIKLPTTQDQLLRCLNMTAPLVQMYGNAILQVMFDYIQHEQSQEQASSMTPLRQDLNLKRTLNVSPTSTMMMDTMDMADVNPNEGTTHNFSDVLPLPFSTSLDRPQAQAGAFLLPKPMTVTHDSSKRTKRSADDTGDMMME